MSEQVKTLVPKLRFPEHQDSNEWAEKPLGDIATFYKGKGLPKSAISPQGKTPCIHYGELFTQYSEVIENVKSRTDVDGDYFRSIANDVIMPTSDVTPNGLAKASCINSSGVVLGGDILVIRTNKSQVSGKFLSRVIRYSERRVLQLVSGSTVFHLYASSLEKLKIPLPQLEEQQKIADCLSSLDDLITAQNQKVEALKQYKKGLMQQLFPAEGETVPKLRFPEFKNDSEWREKPFNEIFSRVTSKNHENNLNVLTISAQMGLVSQLEYFNKSVSAKDVSGYYLLHKGDFAYNKSYSQGYPVGAIKLLNNYDKGVVSTLYICFRAKDVSDNLFFEQYFDAGLLNSQIETIAQEGARNHGLLNLSVVDFFELTKLYLPSSDERKKIASFLTSIDELINIEIDVLDALKEHKKGLMQQLFPALEESTL